MCTKSIRSCGDRNSSRRATVTLRIDTLIANILVCWVIVTQLMERRPNLTHACQRNVDISTSDTRFIVGRWLTVNYVGRRFRRSFVTTEAWSPDVSSLCRISASTACIFLTLLLHLHCLYTVFCKKTWQYICDHYSGKTWWILIIFTCVETGMNALRK